MVLEVEHYIGRAALHGACVRMMSRRWRTGGVCVRPLAAGLRSLRRQELGGRGGAAAAVAAAGVGGRSGERGVVICHRRAASTKRKKRVVAGGHGVEGTQTPLAHRSRPSTAGTAAYEHRASPPRPPRRPPRRGSTLGRSGRHQLKSCRERPFRSGGVGLDTSRHHPFAKRRPWSSLV